MQRKGVSNLDSPSGSKKAQQGGTQTLRSDAHTATGHTPPLKKSSRADLAEPVIRIPLRQPSRTAKRNAAWGNLHFRGMITPTKPQLLFMEYIEISCRNVRVLPRVHAKKFQHHCTLDHQISFWVNTVDTSPAISNTTKFPLLNKNINVKKGHKQVRSP